MKMEPELVEGKGPEGKEDYYFEGPYMVFTAAYHLRRGSCCKSACRHCPYGESGAEVAPEGKA